MKSDQNWLQLTVIQLGGVICLPLLLLGTVMMQRYGWASSMIAIFIGNLILMILGIITSHMTVDNRKTTMENAKVYFGSTGGKLFACVMALSLTGWFAIQLNVISESVFELCGYQAPVYMRVIANLLIGEVITLTALYGMRSLALLSDLSAPLLIVTLIYAVWNCGESVTIESLPLNWSAISLIMAASIAAVVDMPTYFRHAKSQKDALIATLCLFCIVIPLVECAGVFLASQGKLLPLCGGFGCQIWMISFLIFAGWTTNATNLFSTVACFDSIVPNIKESSRVFLMGLLGSCIACFDMLHHFESVLELMGIAVTAMGAVICLRYVALFCNGTPVTSKEYRAHFISWLAGTLLGLCTAVGSLTLTTIPQLDAFIVAGVATLFFQMRGHYETVKE